MAKITVEKKLNDLEKALMQMVYQSRQTDIRFAAFVDEMKVFKNEMADFKNEMKDFKNEMADFKDETRANLSKLDQITADMNRKWGELANKMGTLAEDIVAPGFPYLIERSFGISVEDIAVRRRIKDPDGNSWEFDVVARAGDYFFVVDIKSSYNRTEYLDYFQNTLLSKAHELLPEFKMKKYRLLGCIAAFRLESSIIKRASDMGILAISMGGDYLDFLNFEEVKKIL